MVAELLPLLNRLQLLNVAPAFGVLLVNDT